jgi:hypothetical protein
LLQVRVHGDLNFGDAFVMVKLSHRREGGAQRAGVDFVLSTRPLRKFNDRAEGTLRIGLGGENV